MEGSFVSGISTFGAYVSQLLIGLIFGAIFYWIFRKLRARFQSRRGPPWYQPFADTLKLLFKESIIPAAANKPLFIITPLLAFTSYLIILLSIPLTGIPLQSGDLIVILIFLTVPSIMAILSGSVSGSPYGAIGSSRETVLMVASEFPIALSVIVLVIHVGSLRIGDIVAAQSQTGPFVYLYPFSAIAFFICGMVKLSRKPFDIPDAEVEIVAGPYTEYSGALLAFFEISNLLRWFVIPAIAIDLFFSGGFGNIILFLVLCFLFVVAVSYFDAQNPRFKVDQAFKFLIIWVTALTIIDLIRVSTGWGLW